MPKRKKRTTGREKKAAKKGYIVFPPLPKSAMLNAQRTEKARK
jgi:hypothetical protein